MAEPVKIEGLNQFVRDLKTIDAELPKMVRRAFNASTDLVVDDARPQIPRRSGRARGSVRSRSTQTFARITGGGAKAPHYPWLDFGGRVGRRKSVHRAFLVEGRYIYRSYYDLQARGEFERVMVAELLNVVRSAGIEVD
jgi:hypothetical protein